VISFEHASEDDLMPKATIHNASILIPSLSDQVVRYGLHRTTLDSTMMVGRVKGGKDNFLAMIHSYGFTVSISSPVVMTRATGAVAGER
jgi:hypothetical protein